MEDIMSLTNKNLAAVRRTIAKEVGKDAIASFHESNVFLDVLAVFSILFFFFSMMTALALLPFGWLWALCFIGQGFSLQWMALVSHDIFVHRSVGGKKWSWIGSMFLTIPRFSLPSGYREAHLAHHRHIATDRDTEKYKQDLNTPWRRFLFSTFIGAKMAQAGKFSEEAKSGKDVKHYRAVDTRNPELQQQVQKEQTIQKAFLIALLIGAVVFPKFILLGYILPAFLIGPFSNTLRIIIEHGETNPDNPYHIATFYKTGPISRFVFFWDAGDCHLIHHLYPRIPYYQIGAALKAMRPILLSHGVVERYSFWWLLKGWYVDNYGHRTLWPQEPMTTIQEPKEVLVDHMVAPA